MSRMFTYKCVLHFPVFNLYVASYTTYKTSFKHHQQGTTTIHKSKRIRAQSHAHLHKGIHTPRDGPEIGHFSLSALCESLYIWSAWAADYFHYMRGAVSCILRLVWVLWHRKSYIYSKRVCARRNTRKMNSAQTTIQTKKEYYVLWCPLRVQNFLFCGCDVVDSLYDVYRYFATYI